MNLVEEIKKGNVENVKHLIDAGVNVNARHDSTLSLRRQRLSEEIINLQKAKYRFDEFCGIPLIYAVLYRRVEIVKMLIDAGADLNVVGNYDGTALMWAAYKKHSEVVKLLIAAGAKNDNLDAMIEARKKEREEHIKLFKKGI